MSKLREVKEYYDNGDLKCIYYKDSSGLKQGEYRRYYSNNKLRLKCNYKNDIPIGLSEVYTSEGKLEVRTKVHGYDFRGEYKRWHSNGQLSEHCYYNNSGERDGLYTSYQKDGKKYEQVNYVAGEMGGEYKRWHSNGQLYVHCFYVGGKLHGESREYTEDGELFEPHCRFHVNGEEITHEVKTATAEERTMLQLKWGIECLS